MKSLSHSFFIYYSLSYEGIKERKKPHELMSYLFFFHGNLRPRRIQEKRQNIFIADQCLSYIMTDSIILAQNLMQTALTPIPIWECR